MIFTKNKGKGILLCFMIALFAWKLVNTVTWLEIIGAPVLAILTGMILAMIIEDKSSVSDGISFTSKKILQYAVILLGFGLNLTTIGKVGLASLPIIISTISTSLIVAYAMHKLLKVPGNYPYHLNTFTYPHEKGKEK
ncbi:MAG: putative sulfate exporter family transporter [Lachnospiraceae bacterium]|jgi:uncharacterized membrane protein YadS|nr:putative sulfate exporter family transporter [Lachnospiraceae bacterium]